MNPENLGNAETSSQNGIPSPESSNAAAASALTSAERNTRSSPLKQIRTFQGDVANIISSQQESIVSIQRKEVARKEEVRAASPAERTQEEKSQKKNLVFAALALLFLTLGSGGAWYAYSTYKEISTPPTISAAPNTFISVQGEIVIDTSLLSRDALIQKIQEARTLERGGTAVEHIQLINGIGENAPLETIGGFLQLLRSSAPGSLVRAFDPLFMTGILGGSPAHTFILIKLTSFENAFPGMLAWEITLQNDLLSLFASPAVISNVQPEKEFEDITIQNKDARVLRDANGRTVMLYSFFDNTMLVITDNEESLRALILRLTTEKLSR